MKLNFILVFLFLNSFIVLSQDTDQNSKLIIYKNFHNDILNDSITFSYQSPTVLLNINSEKKIKNQYGVLFYNKNFIETFKKKYDSIINLKYYKLHIKDRVVIKDDSLLKNIFFKYTGEINKKQSIKNIEIDSSLTRILNKLKSNYTISQFISINAIPYERIINNIKEEYYIIEGVKIRIKIFQNNNSKLIYYFEVPFINRMTSPTENYLILEKAIKDFIFKIYHS